MSAPARKPAAAEKKRAAPASEALPARKPPALAPPGLAIVSRDPAELLRQWVDELGRLDAEVVEIRPKLKRVDTLRGLIRERFAEHAPGAGTETRGAEYLATLGPCAFESTIDYDAVMKYMGLKAYAAIARPTLKALEETLAPDVLARVVTRGYTGARPVKTFPLGEK